MDFKIKTVIKNINLVAKEKKYRFKELNSKI